MGKETNMIMKVVHIDELIPAEYNPRIDLKPSDKEYKRLKKSILSFDYVEPIIWNENTKRIVGGHQRLKIMKDLGYEKIQVSVVNVDEIKEKELNIALNKHSGKWNEFQLNVVIGEIKTNNNEFDVESFGFSDEEVEKLNNKFIENELEDPEIEFTQELMEEHNYIVLYFENSFDWQVAKDKFNITTKAALDSREGYERKGIGRVVKGADILDRIT